jgi:hypothetical protein
MNRSDSWRAGCVEIAHVLVLRGEVGTLGKSRPGLLPYGEAAQGYGHAGGRARDVRILNWRMTDSGEPRDTETVPRGSGRGGEVRLQSLMELLSESSI